MSRKTGRVGNGIVDTSIFNPVKNAIAANMAHAANEDRLDAKDAKEGDAHGAIYRAFETAGDIAADTVNIATLGVYRKLANHFDDAESKINYSGMKVAKKEGTITKQSTIDERSQAYLNESLLATEFNIAPSDDSKGEPEVEV